MNWELFSTVFAAILAAKFVAYLFDGFMGSYGLLKYISDQLDGRSSSVLERLDKVNTGIEGLEHRLWRIQENTEKLVLR